MIQKTNEIDTVLSSVSPGNSLVSLERETMMNDGARSTPGSTERFHVDANPLLRANVTVLLAVKNEEVNIERCLKSLRCAAEVIVLDSYSTDRTASIATQHGCKVIQFDYQGGYPKKRQWALESLSIKTDWVLLLDADEVVPPQLWDEIYSVTESSNHADAYFIRKGFHFLGRRFKFGGFSHDALLLLKPGKARFERLIEVPGDKLDMEVHERLLVEGRVGRLNTPLIHEDFKGLQAYIDKHNKYSTWEANLRFQCLKSGRYGEESVPAKLFGNVQERRRWLKNVAVRVPFEAWLWFFYHYIVKLGFLEGRPGLIASQIRSQYIANVRAKLWEIKNRCENT